MSRAEFEQFVIDNPNADYFKTWQAAISSERERCARIADEWGKSKSCLHHDENPCCHVRTGYAIARAIRSGEGQ